MSDEFDGTTPSGWRVYNGDLQDGVPPRYDVGSTTQGQLTIVPGRSWWVDDTRAFYLYKELRGDFKATMLVNATGTQTLLPAANWSLSGILVRDANSGPGKENWVSFRSGVVNRSPTFERKTTSGSRSRLVLKTAVPGWVELRIARVGPSFVLLRHYPGRRWQLHWVYARPDLPPLLQVGIDAFSGFDDTKADLVSHVDYFRFANTGVPATLKRRYLAGKVGMAKLLPYLEK